jgi:hypothetical protein
MQKSLILFMLLCLPFFLKAQTQNQPEDQQTPLAQQSNSFKPQKGNFTLEGLILPLTTSQVERAYFRGRIFAADRVAFRTGLGYNYIGRQDETGSKSQSTKTAFAFLPGFEVHFGSIARFSPYVGAEYVFRRTSESTFNNTERFHIRELKEISRYNGANIVAGTDYYFTRHFYFGVEFGYGFQRGTSVIKEVAGTFENEISRTNFLNVGQSMNGALKLGFVF